MQIMFDLQFLEQHELAIRLFEAAARLIRTADQKREIFYWMGQSWLALEESAVAAAYFLESAGLSGPNDALWKRSALYQAGLALEAGALYEDASRIYEQLMVGAVDPKMQAKLQYRLAQIQLARTQPEHLERLSFRSTGI
jgi:tetratricopeptide (TPR) repeat protein